MRSAGAEGEGGGNVDANLQLLCYKLTTLIAKDGKGRSDKPDDRVCAQEPESEAG